MKGLYWQGEDLFKAIGEKQKCSCKHSQTNSESYLPIILLIHSVAGTAALWWPQFRKWNLFAISTAPDSWGPRASPSAITHLVVAYNTSSNFISINPIHTWAFRSIRQSCNTNLKVFRRCVVFTVGVLLTVCIEMRFMTSEDYCKLTFSLYSVADLENLNSSLNCMPVLVIKLQLPNMTKETFKVLYLPSSNKNTCTCSKWPDMTFLSSTLLSLVS